MSLTNATNGSGEGLGRGVDYAFGLDLSNQLGKLGEGLAARAGLTTQQWLVLQQPEAGDRRRKGLSITGKGRAALARLAASRRHANRVLLAELGAKERAVLLNALRACLRCAAGSVAGAPGSPGPVRQRHRSRSRADRGEAVSTSVPGG